MPAMLNLPRSARRNEWSVLKGFTSVEDIQREKWERYKCNAPPRNFDPAWHIEPTIVNNIDSGVELWKWSISREKWVLDAVIVWKEN